MVLGSGNCKVVVVNYASEWENIAQDVKNQVKMFPFIGLDCEWMSMGTASGTVALIQVRNKTSSKYLI